MGLENLGATCYMNSLLQQLFMVPAFRFGVLSCDPEGTKPSLPREENLLHQLQVLILLCLPSVNKVWLCKSVVTV